MAVFIQKESRHPTILALWNFDYGFGSAVLFLLIIQILAPPATAQIANALPPPPADPFAKLKFDKSMAIIMVVLVIVFFILGFLSVYTRQCAERRIRGRLDFTVQPGASDRQLRRGARGLSPEVIDTFPTFVYSTVKGLKIGTSALECAVCLNEFEEEETLRLIPKCNHVFHAACIDIWLISHSTCPVCRANLVPRSGEVCFVAIQIPDQPAAESDEPDRRSEPESQQNTETEHINNENHGGVLESPKVNLFNRSRTVNQNRPPRSRSTGFSFANLFPRSHSTGHSLVQAGENCERFTLRLPEEVRNNLLNSTLNRTPSCVTFTRVSSERRGYRTRSVGSGPGSNSLQYERFGNGNRSNRRGFTLTVPFFGKSGSSRSAKGPTGSGKPPVERTGVGGDNMAGDRSSDPLFTGNYD